jgi:hypothetical protein
LLEGVPFATTLPAILLSLPLLCAGYSTAAPIPFEYRDGLIWVKVRTAGATEPLNFLLDTGAGSSVLDLGTARRLGVSLGSRERVQRVGEAASARRANGFAAELAGIPVQSNPFALDLAGTSALCSRRIDGLIGHDFFRNRIVQIDFKARCIRVLGSADERGCCAIVPLKVDNSALCVPVSMNGSEPRWTRLDTGCDTGLHWVDGEGGNEVRATVALGDEVISQAPTELHRSEFFPAEAGLLGNAIISRYRITIDAVNHRLLLQRS